MLGALRKASNNWIIKILFALLALSFGAWGIGDMLRVRVASKPAIVVGSDKIAAEAVLDAFRRDTDELKSAFGGKLTIDQARQLGLLDRTIERLVVQSLIAQEAERLDLAVSDDELRQEIAAIPAFQDRTHHFSKDLFERVLAGAGLTERRFVAGERGRLLRQILMQAVDGAVRAPDAITDPIFRYRQERRVADTISFRDDAMPAPKPPSEEVLEAYHRSHARLFTAPETRSLSAIVLSTDDIARTVKPSDADIEKAYQTRQSEFTVPETRDVRQVLFSDRKAAEAMLDAVRKGKDFAAAAAAAGKTVDDLGTVERRALPLAKIGDIAFALAAPGPAGPVQSPLGWHVIDVARINPAKSEPLSEVRERIAADLARQEAVNRLYALSNKLSDTIGSGASLEEAAATLKLPLVKVPAITERGGDADGKPVAGIPHSAAFLQAAFATAAGSTSEVSPLEGDSGYFVLHVDKITPPTLRPFASVRAAVLAAWTHDRQAEAAHKLAEAAVDRLKKGEAMAAVAGSRTVETTKPFLRSGGDGITPLLAAEMFKAELGGSTVVVVPGASLAARLRSVQPADPKQEAGLYEETRKTIDEAIQADLARQYIAVLRRQIGVEINRPLIDSQFSEQ